jgi:hypothetical protein
MQALINQKQFKHLELSSHGGVLVISGFGKIIPTQGFKHQ